ncbi:MAG: putative sugar kinase YdjH [Chloroflexi bacterium ADurb.Bin325]|nr:MAG: putative sugar kinase YdjH [Chloroflexi bacterium ADurb.Bin325]
MSTELDAVVAGHLCLDMIPEIPPQPAGLAGLLVPGKLNAIGPAMLSTGGPVSNTGVVLHKLGVRTQLMGKVGDDLFGMAIRRVIDSHGPGLADGMIVDPAATSSYTVVVNVPGVDRMFLHHTGANDTFTADDVRYDVVARGRLFHFGYPPLMARMYGDDGSEVAELFRRAKATGVTTSLDMALPDPASPAGRADWPAIIRKALPYVDVFLPSLDEMLFMLRRPTYERLLAEHAGDLLAAATPDLLADLTGEMLALGAKIAGLKLGQRGFYLRTAGRAALAAVGRAAPADPDAWADRQFWAPCFRVAVVGTTGAGDSTIAGFLAGLLRGLSPEETLAVATAVGACNVEAADALGGIRPWAETLDRMAAGWPRHEMSVDAPGWEHAAAHGVWTAR